MSWREVTGRRAGAALVLLIHSPRFLLWQREEGCDTISTGFYVHSGSPGIAGTGQDRAYIGMDNNSINKRKRIISAGIFLSAIALMIILAILLAKPVAGLAAHPEELREAVKNNGPISVLGFVGLLILQVFAAVVPGGPFEIAAGYAFGLIPGALVCDVGMTAGGLLVFLLTRRFGMSFVELFFKPEEIEKAKFLKTTDRSKALIFLLFLIPGIPKDIMSYLLGLTDLSIREFFLFSFVGRFPAILLSSLSGNALAGERYGIFAGALIIILALTAAGMLWYRKKHTKEKTENDKKQSKEGSE